MGIGERIKSDMWAAAPAAVVLAYLGGPEAKLFDPMTSGLIGVCIAAALTMVMGALTMETKVWERAYSVLALLFALTAFWILTREIARVDDVNNADNAVCMTIQRDMLSARPRKANGPEIFQALGCRPQGTDPRVFVPPVSGARAKP